MTSSIDFMPSSLQRIRLFLSDRGRLKIKPWASAEEILEALTQSLSACQDDDAFWVDLQSLLTALMGDFQHRSPCGVLPNEPLDPARRCGLLSEIRAALNPAEIRPTFRTLLTRVSIPTAAILLLIGTLVTSSCASDPTVPVDGGSNTTPVQMDANRSVDGRVNIPDVPLPPPWTIDANQARDLQVPDGGFSVFIQRMMACFPNFQDTDLKYWQSVDACFDRLGPEWREQVMAYLDASFVCRSYGFCRFDVLQQGAEAGADACKPAQDYDPDLIFCSVPIYLGVRFE